MKSASPWSARQQPPELRCWTLTGRMVRGIRVLVLGNTGGLDARGVTEPLASAVLRRALSLPDSAIRADVPARPDICGDPCGWYRPEPDLSPTCSCEHSSAPEWRSRPVSDAGAQVLPGVYGPSPRLISRRAAPDRGVPLVETCANSPSGKPSARRAAVSPPPIMVKASLSARAWATARVPSAKRARHRRLLARLAA